MSSPTAPDRISTTEIDDALARIAAGAVQRERDGTRPFEQIDLVRKSGLGALRVPSEFGGRGDDLRGFFDVLISLGRADPDVAQILRAHFGFGEVVRFLPDADVRRRWFELFTSGSIVGNAVTERGPVQAGDFVGLATTFTPDGADHVIDGVKYYSTGTLYADHVWVWGATPDPLPISAVVPVSRVGVTVTDDWDGFGQRATGSGTTRFDGVRAAADEVFASSPEDPPAPRLTTGAFLQLYLTAIVAGIAQAVSDDAVTLLRGRGRNFTHGNAELPREDPVLLQVAGELSASAHAARSTVLAAADALDRAERDLLAGRFDTGAAQDASLAAAHAKTVVDELTLNAATRLFDVGGASATSRTADLDRHWRSARTLASHNSGPLKRGVVGDHLLHGTELPDNTYF